MKPLFWLAVTIMCLVYSILVFLYVPAPDSWFHGAIGAIGAVCSALKAKDHSVQ